MVLYVPQSHILQAGKLEVIEKRPELFKIECLTKLRELFLCPTPFFAGYGNRQNDLVAYQAVGIPRCRVFLINKLGILSGQVSCLNLHSFYKILQVALNQQSSYCGHCDLVSLLFPALSTSSIINLTTKVREVSFTARCRYYPNPFAFIFFWLNGMLNQQDNALRFCLLKENGSSNSPSFWSPPLPQIDPEDPLLSTLTK